MNSLCNDQRNTIKLKSLVYISIFFNVVHITEGFALKAIACCSFLLMDA